MIFILGTELLEEIFLGNKSLFNPHTNFCNKNHSQFLQELSAMFNFLFDVSA